MMLEKLKSSKGELVNLLWWKLAVTILGFFFALVNQLVHPTDLAPLPETTTDQDIASIRIGVFAIITAVALFASLIPTGTETRDKLVNFLALALGVVATFGAGWHTLDVATVGNSGLYLVGLGSLTGLTIVALLMGAGIWAVIILMARAIASAIDAAILCLQYVVKLAIRFIIGRLRGGRDKGNRRRPADRPP